MAPTVSYGIDSIECVEDPRIALAVHHLVGQPGALQGSTHAPIDRLPDLRPVALQAIGHPGQVQPGQQRGGVATLVLQREGVERRVVEQQFAVDRGHQRRGVGHHQVGAGPGTGRMGAAGLLGGDAHLLVGARRASLALAPATQHLVDHHDPQAERPQAGCQGGRQGGLAGAFGADNRNSRCRWGRCGHAGVSTGAIRCCHARQPTMLSAAKSAYSTTVSHRPL